MKPDCRSFRVRLAHALRGPAPATHEPALGGLAWHRHVIDCAACRALLDEEEALDELLRSLPEPHLPRALAERVLCRLESARRGGDLDRLLDLPSSDPVPADLAHNVLARVHAEQRLDRLLELVPTQPVPVGLERRVLARLELARRGKAGKTRPQPAGGVRRVSSAVPATSSANTMRFAPIQLSLRIAAGVALASLAAWGAWSLRRTLLEPSAPQPLIVEDNTHIDGTKGAPTHGLPIPEAPVQVKDAPAGIVQPDEQLLASLEMFEAWDLLASADSANGASVIDASLVTLDSLDEYLLDFESDAQSTDGAPAPESPGRTLESDPVKSKKNG